MSVTPIMVQRSIAHSGVYNGSMTNIVHELENKLTTASEKLLADNGFSQSEIHSHTRGIWGLEVVSSHHVTGDLFATGAMKISGALKAAPGATAEMLCQSLQQGNSDSFKSVVEGFAATRKGYINLIFSHEGMLQALSSLVHADVHENRWFPEWLGKHPPYAQVTSENTPASQLHQCIYRCINILKDATRPRFDVYRNVELPPLVASLDHSDGGGETFSLKHYCVSESERKLILYSLVLQADMARNEPPETGFASAYESPQDRQRHTSNLANCLRSFFKNNSALMGTENSSIARVHLLNAVAVLLARSANLRN